MRGRPSTFVRYAAAGLVLGAAFLVRQGLVALIGDNLPPYITFYPTVAIVALALGFGPGLLATLMGALLADYFFLVPLPAFGVASTADAVGLALFAGTGILISTVAEIGRRSRPADAEQQADFVDTGAAPRPVVSSGVLMTIGFALSFVILTLAGWRSYHNLTLQDEAESSAAHTYLVQRQLEHLLSALKDVETGQRAYAISGNEHFLLPYNNAVEDVRASLDELKQLTAADAGQQPRIAALGPLVRNKLAFARNNIELALTRGLPSVRAAISDGAGEAVMSEIRRKVAEVQADEEALLRRQLEARSASRTTTLRGLLAGNSLGLLMLGTIFFFLVQENRRRQRAERRLRRERDHLDDTVAQRTVALQDSEQRIAAILGSAMDAIITIDAEQHIVMFNPAAELMFGHGAEVVRGANLDMLLPPRWRDAHRQHVRDFGATGLTARRMGALQTITGLHASGAEFPVEASIAQVEAGGQRYYTVILRDITARKQAEAALRVAKAEAEQANNAKSRFLAAASHDLRQPLTALALYVDVLSARGGTAGDVAMITNIRDCVGSLSALLKDLLDLSKLDAGVVQPQPSDFKAAELLARVMSAHAPLARQKGLDLRCRPCGLVLRTDAVLLERLLGNLVSNAIRYTERGGVLLGCRRRQGKVWLEVWDTGIGIPPDKTAEVFEEFRQLHNDERGQGKGSGLGLAIVARTAALLDLQIRVHSRPGRGSCFAVELPPGAAAPAPPAPAGASRLACIALVEDHAVVRLALACALEAVGHTVVAAASGRDLLTRLDGRRPDIVISDYRLDVGETGFDVIAASRAACGGAALAAIILTGDTDATLMRRMAEQDVRVLHKPVELPELQAAIDQLLSGVST